MMDQENIPEEPTFEEHDYCPICGELAVGEKKHICPEHILDEICREEEARSESFDNDDDKTFGERLDDAEFMLNYYDEYEEDDDDDYCLD